MTRIEKNEIYDEMCRTITYYEEEPFDSAPKTTHDGTMIGDLYRMLVKIQNNWEELTGDDE